MLLLGMLAKVDASVRRRTCMLPYSATFVVSFSLHRVACRNWPRLCTSTHQERYERRENKEGEKASQSASASIYTHPLGFWLISQPGIESLADSSKGNGPVAR
jgi:hypothetical protein